MYVCPVWRYSSPPSCRPVLGDHWEVQSDQVLHSSDSHPPADEVRTWTAAEVRACISSECCSSSKNHIFQKPQQEFEFQNTAWPDRWSECVFTAFIWKFPPLILKDLLLTSYLRAPQRWRNQTECVNNDESDTVWTCFFHTFPTLNSQESVKSASVISVKKMWGKL